jgi:membrane protein
LRRGFPGQQTRVSDTTNIDDTNRDEKFAGRRPEGPAHPRETGLIQTLKRTVAEFREDNLTDWAAALTYYSVLSVFPALIALVSIVGLVGDPKTITKELTDIVTAVGPASAADTLKEPIADLTKSSGTAGILLIVGIVSAIWTASAYVGAFMRASNAIYEVEEGRSFIKLRPLQMAVTLVLVLLLAAVLLALVLTGPVAEEVGSAIGIGSTAVTIWDIAKWPILAGMVLLVFAILYYSAPNAKLPGFKFVTPGSLLALVVWLVASAGFAFYVANFGSYNKTYGTLGGVIAFLVWIWLTNVAILLGAELNAERERSREIEAGLPGAERELQLEERSEPSEKQRSRTA